MQALSAGHQFFCIQTKHKRLDRSVFKPLVYGALTSIFEHRTDLELQCLNGEIANDYSITILTITILTSNSQMILRLCYRAYVEQLLVPAPLGHRCVITKSIWRRDKIRNRTCCGHTHYECMTSFILVTFLQHPLLCAHGCVCLAYNIDT